MLYQIKLPFLFSTLLCLAFTQSACAKPQTGSSLNQAINLLFRKIGKF